MKLLIDDRQTAHTERFNNNENVVGIVVCDILMTRNTIQSDFFINKIAKLSNQVRGQFCIVQYTDRGSYFVRDLYKLDILELKFIAT